MQTIKMEERQGALEEKIHAPHEKNFRVRNENFPAAPARQKEVTLPAETRILR